MVDWKKKLLVLILILLVLPASASPGTENLDELDDTRTARRGTNTFYSGSSGSPLYHWQSSSLRYVDVTTGHEVWRIYQTVEDEECHHSEEYGHKSVWSADGKRVVIYIDTDRLPYSRGGSGRQNGAYFTFRSDYTEPRIAHDHIIRTARHRFNFGWSPAEPDVAYQIGADISDEGYSNQWVYKATVSDDAITVVQWVNTGTASDKSIEKGMSSDGKKAWAHTWHWNSDHYIITLFPADSRALDASYDTGTNRNWDTAWGDTSADWTTEVHNGRVVGNDTIGYWLYVNEDGAGANNWWRMRLTGSHADGGPQHTQDSTPDDYVWFTGSSTQTEMQPVNTVNGDDPWCIDSAQANTDCSDYWTHAYQSVDGTLTAFGASGGMAVYDSENRVYIENVIGTPSSSQHTNWNAWSDYIADWPGAGNNPITIYNYIDDTDFQVCYTHEEGSTDDEGVNQSPDGTKLAWGGSWLMAGEGYEDYDIFIVTAYYPYPPQITSCTATSGVVTITFEWMLDSTPRGYTTRGWPDPDSSDPPPPRETEKFRLWRSTDKNSWSPRSTKDAEIFSRYDFSDGTWNGSDSWTIKDSPGNGTFYYMVTSVEWSGLESHTPSNIYTITVSGGSGTGSQDTAYPSSPGDLDDISTSDIQTSFVEGDTSIIRAYNIYANDGSAPSIQQQDLIATISKNACSGGSCHWVDWLGNVNETTEYIVAAVDTQGNISDSTFVTNQSYTSCENGDCSSVSPEPTAEGQYLIEWDDMFVSSPSEPGSGSMTHGTGSITHGTGSMSGG